MRNSGSRGRAMELPTGRAGTADEAGEPSEVCADRSVRDSLSDAGFFLLFRAGGGEGEFLGVGLLDDVDGVSGFHVSAK